MNDTTLVSVIVPAFNVERFIDGCLRSLLNQSLQNIEILVYDDGSTDKTWDRIISYRSEKVNVFKGDKNKGVVFARNFLIEKARGKYIAFQDADDWSHSERLSMQYQLLETTPELGACGTQFHKVVDGRIVYTSSFVCDGEQVRKALPKQFYFLPASLMVRRKVLDAVGWYDEFFGNDGHEDLYLLSKVIWKYGFANVDAPLYYYNLNLKSLTKFSVRNRRKFYIDEMTQYLLGELINTGTNALEQKDQVALNLMEDTYRDKVKNVSSFQVFEKIVGQLLFYRLHGIAIRETFKHIFRGEDVLPSFRLLGYLVKISVTKWR